MPFTGSVLTPAPLQGTVKIHIQDIYTYEECFVFLHDVLYVPGLSRRLLSVRQWNTTGGDVLFEMDHCVLSVLDADSHLSFDMHVRPPYATDQEELHGPDANATVTLDTIQEENDNTHDAYHAQTHLSNASKIKEEKKCQGGSQPNRGSQGLQSAKENNTI